MYKKLPSEVLFFFFLIFFSSSADPEGKGENCDKTMFSYIPLAHKDIVIKTTWVLSVQLSKSRSTSVFRNRNNVITDDTLQMSVTFFSHISMLQVWNIK